MPLRAFLPGSPIRLLATTVLAVVLGLALTVGVDLPDASAGGSPVAAATTGPTDSSATTGPTDTVNPFLPEDRGISDCISALPKPGCGSEERGGWHQYLVLIALVVGLSIIGWRIAVGLRAGRPPTDGRPTDRNPSDRNPSDRHPGDVTSPSG